LGTRNEKGKFVMRSRYKILNNEGLFFITSTTVEWIPVFTSEKFSNINRINNFLPKEQGLEGNGICNTG